MNALLKKLGIDHLNLTNREKVQVIDALRDKYSLNTLLKALQLSKSSYFYQRDAIAKGDKFAAIRPRLKVVFKQNYESYGYRRIKMELNEEGIHLSEKVIRRLMSEEGLEVTIIRCRKYSSYAGKVTPAVPNILDRDFQAETPNQKLVTDITEFSIQAGKVYLSSLIALTVKSRVGQLAPVLTLNSLTQCLVLRPTINPLYIQIEERIIVGRAGLS